MYLNVDPDRCQGHALCLFAAPDLVDLDEVTSHAVVVRAEVPPELAAQAHAAVDGCPEAALAVST